MSSSDSPDICDSVHTDDLLLVLVSVAVCEVKCMADSPQTAHAVHPGRRNFESEFAVASSALCLDIGCVTPGSR